MLDIHFHTACVAFECLLFFSTITNNVEGNKIAIDVACSKYTQHPTKFNGSLISVKNISSSLIEATYEFLALLNTSSAIFVVPDNSDLQIVRCFLNRGIKSIAVQNLTNEIIAKIKQSLQPSHYILFGASYIIQDLLFAVYELRLATGDVRWTIIRKDSKPTRIPKVIPLLTTLKISDRFRCLVLEHCDCEKSYNDCHLKVEDVYLKWISELSTESVNNLNEVINKRGLPLVFKNYEITLDVEIEITVQNFNDKKTVSLWTPSMKFKDVNFASFNILRRKLRISMIYDPPFLINFEHKFHNQYNGFCIDVLHQLQQLMDFDYELIFPSTGDYGIKQKDGSWDGLIGLLITGDADLVLAPISITTEAASVIDFVQPLFDHRGISIVGRRRETMKSLFKFTRVMKIEVWMGVLASIFIIGMILWLDENFCLKCKSNSTQIRWKDLKEWIWYAFISFTPQGGGDVPTSWCGKLLVACYWLFVLLIVSAFNSNLTALLTVERMYRQVKSLQEMLREPKFGYTAVENSDVLQYFVTMAKSEEEIFNLWKIYGNFINWEYPVNERFKYILAKIKQTGTVKSLQEGIQKVKANREGNFAIFTNSFTAHYLVNQDCDLEIIGEPFAEHPYGFAVRKGSSLLNHLTESMLKLQRERFLEDIMERYLSRNITCSLPQSDSISLYELGGVFILASTGLSVAVITLIVEVYVLKKKNSWKSIKTIAIRKNMPRKKTNRVRRF